MALNEQYVDVTTKYGPCPSFAVCGGAAEGGPLALVQNGDRIRLSVKDRRFDLLVSEEELAKRRAAWRPVDAEKRGYAKLYQDHVLQADEGCDFDFLRSA